jgi:phosphatidylglycerol---prolipoprotein diacylglyceryl transferase
MPPDGFHLGPLYIRFYGILIMLGAIAATYLAAYLAKKRGENPEVAWDMLIWLLIGGIIGARLWHILFPPASMIKVGLTTGYYLTHPLDAINTTNGGLGIPGAVIGGALALFWYTRRHRMSFAVWVDLVAPGLALAQAVGRWGNFLNQEIYGLPTDLPWKIYIDPAHRDPAFSNVAYYHPLFLYESLYNLLNMAFLLWAGKKWKKWLRPGDLFIIYLITYPFFRFWLEFLRLDPAPVAGIDVNQTVMAVVTVAAAALLFVRHRKPLPEVAQEEEPEVEAEAEPSDETGADQGMSEANGNS